MSAHQPSLLLATSSADKIREYRQILGRLPLDLLTPTDLGLHLEIEETGSTFRENALLKARAYWAAAGVACLAEDSGFEVDALAGAPGVQSARWEGNDYERKNRLVLDLVSGRVGLARRCRYVCSIAFVDPSGQIHQAAGRLTGRVAQHPSWRGWLRLRSDLRATPTQAHPGRADPGREGRAQSPSASRAPATPDPRADPAQW